MKFEAVLEAVHHWLEIIEKECEAATRIEVVQDTEEMFRAIFETEHSVSELIVNRSDFTPYRYVSFQTLDTNKEPDKALVFCFYDDGSCTIRDIISQLDMGVKSAIVRERFLLASEEFGFEIIMPICLDEEKQLNAFAYMPGYGSENGAIICLLSSENESEAEIKDWCRENKYFCSSLNVEPLLWEYKRSYFRELLRDWKV